MYAYVYYLICCSETVLCDEVSQQPHHVSKAAAGGDMSLRISENVMQQKSGRQPLIEGINLFLIIRLHFFVYFD